VLYEVQTGRTGMAPPITYDVDGVQYVAFAGGLGRAATAVGPNTATVENAPMLFVFKLGGTGTLPSAPQPSTTGSAPEQQP
jgi:quinohemoprotein ethanol dehydrogenase